MATADFTAADPSAPGGSMALLNYTLGQQAHDYRSDYNRQMNRSTDIYSQRTLPQLQSSIASAGNWYSGARRKAENQSYQDLTRGQEDMGIALRRQLDELDRQRVYAALGLVV